MRPRAALAALVLGVAIAGPIACPIAIAVQDPAEMLASPAAEARAERIGQQLRCLVCQNESIEDSGAPLARDLRRIVRTQVAQGRSNAEIMRWMVARYGTFVRLSPPFDVATLLLWGMPVIALAAAGLLARLAFRGAAAAAVPPAPLDETERRRLADLVDGPA